MPESFTLALPDTSFNYAKSLKELKTLREEYYAFYGEVASKSKWLHSKLRNITSPLYKNGVLRHLTARNDVCTDAVIGNWHNPTYDSEDKLKESFNSFEFAIRQAREYARMLSK